MERVTLAGSSMRHVSARSTRKREVEPLHHRCSALDDANALKPPQSSATILGGAREATCVDSWLRMSATSSSRCRSRAVCPILALRMSLQIRNSRALWIGMRARMLGACAVAIIAAYGELASAPPLALFSDLDTESWSALSPASWEQRGRNSSAKGKGGEWREQSMPESERALIPIAKA